MLLQPLHHKIHKEPYKAKYLSRDQILVVQQQIWNDWPFLEYQIHAQQPRPIAV